jgi:hypothetical protein
MGIAVTPQSARRYDVVLSPPHGPDWRSPSPLTATEVLRELVALGCHSTDVTDALYAADPSWAESHNEGVFQRHEAGRDDTEQ